MAADKRREDDCSGAVHGGLSQLFYILYFFCTFDKILVILDEMLAHIANVVSDVAGAFHPSDFRLPPLQ